VDPLHGLAGTDHAVPRLGRIDLWFFGFLLFHGRGLMGAPEHYAKVANRRRPADVAVGTLANQFIGGRPEDVIRQDEERNFGSDKATGAVKALTNSIMVGIQVENNDLAVLFENHSLDSGFAGFDEELEFPTQG